MCVRVCAPFGIQCTKENKFLFWILNFVFLFCFYFLSQEHVLFGFAVQKRFNLLMMGAASFIGAQ